MHCYCGPNLCVSRNCLGCRELSEKPVCLSSNELIQFEKKNKNLFQSILDGFVVQPSMPCKSFVQTDVIDSVISI